MTFHAYLQYVCLLVVCLCTLPSPMEARVQADRQSTGTRDTLLVIDQESGLPIEGAYILTGERLLVSSPRGMIVFGHGTCFMDTVLVQCLGYGSRRVPLNEVFKESSIHTVCLSLDIQKLGEVVVTGEHAGVSPNVVSRRLSSPEIRNALGTSLATLLERVSGVSSISTGTTVSKPLSQCDFHECRILCRTLRIGQLLHQLRHYSKSAIDRRKRIRPPRPVCQTRNGLYGWQKTDFCNRRIALPVKREPDR